MAWTVPFTPAIYTTPAIAAAAAAPIPMAPSLAQDAAYRQRYQVHARGRYRIFGTAGYRFYRSAAGPPAESDPPFATSSSLPYTPAETFADGVWYLAMSRFNGVLDSGFAPIGPRGETYLELEVAGGAALTDPPLGPIEWHLEARAGGVVRVVGLYHETGEHRAEEWAIAYTVDGTDPAADTPDIWQGMPAGGLALLSYDLPAAADGATVKVRLQTRRNDGSEETPAWRYSARSTVAAIFAVTVGPSGPLSADTWPGALPQE